MSSGFKRMNLVPDAPAVCIILRRGVLKTSQNSKPYLHSILHAKVFKRCLKGVELGDKLTCHWPRSLPMTASGDKSQDSAGGPDGSGLANSFFVFFLFFWGAH